MRSILSIATASNRFFLYVPHLAIHFPWQGPEDPPHRKVGNNYKQDKWGLIPDRSNVQPHVRAMIEAIDTSTGRIVAELQRLELDKRTVVIFTSDNGGYLNYGKDFKNISSNGKLRGQKGTLYEGGHRVPLIVSWPAKIKPTVSNVVAHSNDFLPTICSFAGIDVKDSNPDGVDLSSVLLEGTELADRTLYWRAGQEWAIREGAFKLVFERQRRELFQLENDIAEANDLSARHPELVKRLTKKWKAWNERMPP